MQQAFDSPDFDFSCWDPVYTLFSTLLFVAFGSFSALHLFYITDMMSLYLLISILSIISAIFTGFKLLPSRRWSFAAECATSAALGFIFVLGCHIADGLLVQLGIFISSLAVYHEAEYVFVCVYHYETISFNSFLINQSWYYVCSTLIGLTEYTIEIYLLGEYKAITFLMIIGIAGMAIGQIMRIGALFSAGKNFHHIIQQDHEPDHVLVTDGLYAFCRHPGYLGWYLWAISSQIMLINPISLCLYMYACHLFFKVRIEYEEETLIEMFGKKYIEYMKKVPTRIPYIPGLNIKEYTETIFKLRTWED